MTIGVFAVGVILILVGLASRHEERRALILFAIGAVLVAASGLLAVQNFNLP